jgi:hypothetical protein
LGADSRLLVASGKLRGMGAFESVPAKLDFHFFNTLMANTG